MTHYFYIHISLFIVNGFLCGLIVYLIENYSSLRNTQIEVAYVDAWFVASSCVYNCGLTTLDFAKLSHTSQIILMVFTFISGITISTLPALVIKARTHKKVEGITVDDDHGDLEEDEPTDELPTINIRRRQNLPEDVRNKLASLPTAAQLRYRAYITCIVLILGTCFTIYSITYVAIGSWLTTQYTSEQLLQGNSSLSPWYISFIVTVTGFNQNGLTPFSDGFARFVYDVYLNLFVMMVNNLI
jgi:Trk-type K+ transport system membrane component